MATNPKLPDYPNIPPRKSPDDHAKVQMIRKSKFPWPLLALIAGVAMLIAIIAVLPRNPKVTTPPTAAQIPQQPTGEQIQLSNVRIVPATVGDSLYLDAMLRNVGNMEITGVQVNAEFLNGNGASAGHEDGVVQNVAGGTTHDLTQTPIQPNANRPVRIYFAHTPKGWNHEVPSLTVKNVSATTP